MDSKSLNLVNYYKSQFLRGRTIAASLWTVAALHIGLFLVTVFSAFQLSPYDWLTNSLWPLISFRFWFLSSAATLSILPLVYQNVNKFSVLPSITTRRVDGILSFFDPSNIMAAFCHFTFALVFSVVLMLVHGPTMSLDHMMILNTSLILAIYLPFHNQKRYQYQFPIVQVSKLIQVKTNLKQLIPSTFKSSVWLSVVIRLLCCFVIYPQAGRNSLLGLISNEDGKDIGHVLDLWSFYHQFVIVFAVNFFSNLHLCLHNIFQTEPITFPITTKMSGNKCLSEALTCHGHPLIQHLAFMDLSRISNYDAKRRLDIFSLSVPGRHPLNWQAVVGACLTQLDDYVADLSAHVYTVLDGGLYGGQTVGQDQHLPRASGLNKSLSTSQTQSFSPLKSSPQHSVLYPTTPTRLRSASDATPGKPKPAFLTSPKSSKRKSSYSDALPKTDRLFAFFADLAKSVMQFRIISYFLSELPEMRNRKMFKEAQKYIWLVQGISSLALHSYEEDQFGVVQKNLSDILNSLLALDDILYKPLPMSAPGKKCSTEESRLRSSLRSEVKSGIYKITITFKEGLGSLTINPEHQNKLQLFKGLKE